MNQMNLEKHGGGHPTNQEQSIQKNGKLGVRFLWQLEVDFW